MSFEMSSFNVIQFIGAAAGLGTASFGIIETMKSRWPVGKAGFQHVTRLLGPLLPHAVRTAFGENYMDVLLAQYKGDRRELRRSLRQGARVGLTAENANVIAGFLGVIPDEELALFAGAAGRAILRGPDSGDGGENDRQLTDYERMLLARYEMAVDSRIEAALSVAQNSYACTARTWAMICSVIISLGVGTFMAIHGKDPRYLVMAFLIGLVAVPVAPIAKDLSKAIKSLHSGLKR